MLKYCPTCKQILPLANFARNKSKSNGHASWCKTCNALYEKSPRRILSRRHAVQRYRERHPEKFSASLRKPRPITHKSREASMLAERAANAKYYRKHAEAICRKHRAKRQANLEQQRAKDRAAFLARPKEQQHAHNKHRRARKAGVPLNDLTAAQWREIQEAQEHRCYYCHTRCKGRLTQDHLTPLSKGGSHTLHNVIGACVSCNSKKRTGPPPVPVQPLLLTIAPSKKKKVS